MNSAFLQERIDATKAQITAYEDAALALGSGGLQSYTIDTGQNRTVVTRLDLATIHTTIDSLYNRLATLCARRNGGVSIARPVW